MESRSIAVAIILTIITCGIYGLYWMYTIARGFDENPTHARVGTSPGVTVLLFIITGGIYGIYAYYKWGQASAEIGARYGRSDGDKAILYLLLAIFGLSLINDALIQSDFNEWLANTPYPPGSGYPPNQGQSPYHGTGM